MAKPPSSRTWRAGVGEAPPRGAHREWPRRHRAPLGTGRRSGVGQGAPERRHIATRGQHLQRLQDGLGVLGLVLGHHLEDEALGQQGRGGVVEIAGGERLQRALADRAQVVVGGRLVQDLGLSAARSRRLEGVVDVVQLGVEGRVAAHATREPQLLVGPDVPEVPEGRAQEAAHLGHEALVVERREQLEGAAPGRAEPFTEEGSAIGHAVEDSPSPRDRDVIFLTWWGPSQTARNG